MPRSFKLSRLCTARIAADLSTPVFTQPPFVCGYNFINSVAFAYKDLLPRPNYCRFLVRTTLELPPELYYLCKIYYRIMLSG